MTIDFTRLIDVQGMQETASKFIGHKLTQLYFNRRWLQYRSQIKDKFYGDKAFRVYPKWVEGDWLSSEPILEHVGRRGKYLMLGWGDCAWRIALGQYGSLVTKHAGKVNISMVFDGSNNLKLVDARKSGNSGSLQWFNGWDSMMSKGFKSLGVDILSPLFTLDYLYEVLNTGNRKEMPIANVLLRSEVSPGIDNDVRCNALWSCGINPHTKVKDLGMSDILNLHENLLTLTRGPLRNSVWRRSEPCAQCGAIIKREKVWNWALYWCPVCQK